MALEHWERSARSRVDIYSLSSGTSCRYLAFLRAPSWHRSGQPFLTHRAQGRAERIVSFVQLRQR